MVDMNYTLPSRGCKRKIGVAERIYSKVPVTASRHNLGRCPRHQTLTHGSAIDPRASDAVPSRVALIKTLIGCHTFRATGITAYLKNGGKLDVAQQMAAHESARTTGL